MNSTLIVSPSPHVHSGDSIGKNMYGVLIALVPAFLVSLYCFGLGALICTKTILLINTAEIKRIKYLIVPPRYSHNPYSPNNSPGLFSFFVLPRHFYPARR